MAPPNEAQDNHNHHHNNYINSFINNTSSHFHSLFPFQSLSLSPSPTKQTKSKPSKISLPILFADSPSDFTQSSSSFSPATPKGVSSGSSFPSTVRISVPNSRDEGDGPAFVGQVFSMCDLSGTGLMAVSTHFDIPFLSKRTPEWIKKIFATATKSQRNGPVFRFFMDLGDAVSYVKKLNIPSGVVGACRLDLAYEHFKEKPHLFQFVPNEKQVKEANKILKTLPHKDGRVRIDGVPVFTAQNIDIAIATTDGIKWYTPYFFDKNMLDSILEESVDQHFQSLIHNRHMHRRRNVIDDDMADIVEENGDSPWEPPEVQEVLDEVGHPEIPLSVISKVAEMQLLYAVDNVLLGNRWLRKATGIQPKFSYGVDTFEKRTAASLQRISTLTSFSASSERKRKDTNSHYFDSPEYEAHLQAEPKQKQGFKFPFADWISHAWSKQQGKLQNRSNIRECTKQELQPSPLLPKITMVGISTREAGQMSKATLKKTMEELTRELEETEQGRTFDNSSSSNEYGNEDRHPLFVANMGDYYSGVAKTGTARWVRGG